MDRPTLNPFQVPRARLPQRMREHPLLNARFRAHLAWLVTEAWDETAMRARAETVRAVLETAPQDDGRVRLELEDFRELFPVHLDRFSRQRAFLEELLEATP